MPDGNGTVAPGADAPALDKTGPAAPAAWRRVAGAVLAVALLGALVWLVVKGWGRLPEEALRPNWWLIALSFVTLRVVILVACLRWLAVLRALGGAVSASRAYVVCVLAKLGRYVPGKAALVAAKAYLCVREGVSLRLALMSAFYEQALHMIGAAIIVALWIGASGQALPPIVRWASVVVAALGVVAVHPRLVSWAARVVGRLLRRQVTFEGLSYGRMLPLEIGYLAYWLLNGLAFYLFVRAFHELPLIRVLDCTAIIAVAMVVGLVTLVAPAGLGVLEGTSTVLLSAYMPLPLAAAVSLALRVNLAVGEVCDVALALALRARQRRGGRTEGCLNG